VEPEHRLVIRFHDPVNPPDAGRGADRVAALTQAVADELGRAIAAHPQDWHMLQPLFLSDLTPDADRVGMRSGAAGL
jgi:phosphatidylinositol dimannoside acyltransferase